MITITGYLHRETLRELILRWMYGKVRPSDGEDIVRLVYFNNAYVARYLAAFSEAIFTRFRSYPLEVRQARLKGDLKDVIIDNLPYWNIRMDELVKKYRSLPEVFYRETPFHGSLYFCRKEGHAAYIGSSRIKRVRRLAEKSARRIIDSIFFAIQKKADALADNRARRLGIEREELVTPPGDMAEEFLKAESRLLDDLKQGRPIQNDDELLIQDVAGIKAIVEDADQSRFMDMLHDVRGCEVIEIEPHAGVYNATNLIVRLKPPKEKLLASGLGKPLLKIMKARGFDPETANRKFREFVRSGEAHVHMEVILSNYQEMLESEIGRCMHEDRIIRQRLEQPYNGNLARNIEFIMEYLFTFPASPQTRIECLPIKLWHRYLPDYFDEVMKNLFSIPSVEVLE